MHCLLGAQYPVGGASEIPYRIVPVIERSGGRVLVKAPVTEILTENGRSVGVRVGSKSSTVDIFAPIVISDAGTILFEYFISISTGILDGAAMATEFKTVRRWAPESNEPFSRCIFSFDLFSPVD